MGHTCWQMGQSARPPAGSRAGTSTTRMTPRAHDQRRRFPRGHQSVGQCCTAAVELQCDEVRDAVDLESVACGCRAISKLRPRCFWERRPGGTNQRGSEQIFRRRRNAQAAIAGRRFPQHRSKALMKRVLSPRGGCACYQCCHRSTLERLDRPP